MSSPASGQRPLKILTGQNRFVLGIHGRHMKIIRYLGASDQLCGVPVATRNWKAIAAIATVLRDDPSDRTATR
jgi:hypothetical protein